MCTAVPGRNAHEGPACHVCSRACEVLRAGDESGGKNGARDPGALARLLGVTAPRSSISRSARAASAGRRSDQGHQEKGDLLRERVLEGACGLGFRSLLEPLRTLSGSA